MTGDVATTALAQRDVVTPDAVVPEPWANGLGVTRVIERRLAWRLSVAEMRGGTPFSHFPGLDRILLVAGDQPLGLAIEGRVHRLAPGDSVRFPGEARVRPSPTSLGARVVNLMTVRSLATHRAERIVLDGRVVVPPRQDRIVVVLTGVAALDGVSLPHGSALLPSSDPRVLTGRGALAALTVAPVPGIPLP